MQTSGRWIGAVFACFIFSTAPLGGAERWPVRDVELGLDFESSVLADLGLGLTWDGAASPRFKMQADGSTEVVVAPGNDANPITGRIPLAGGFTLTNAAKSVRLGRPVLQIAGGRLSFPLALADGDIGPEIALLEIVAPRQAFDRPAGVFLFESYNVRISEALAERLGKPALTGTVVATAYGRVDGVAEAIPAAELISAGSALPLEGADGFVAGGNNGTVCPRGSGPDVIVGDLPDTANYAALNQIDAFAFGTSSCNVGNQNLQWVQNTNQHPVIGQNMFRLKDGKFEQIGQAWLKHGFLALTENICGCGCSGQGGSVLGVGCSDPYNASLNGSQSVLGPKWQVNAFTGAFAYPFTHGNQGATGNSTYKRLQVAFTDLEIAGTSSSTHYYFEGQYVTPDEAAAGNHFNNCSYRRVFISGGTSDFVATFNASFPTQREKEAIRAWKVADPTVRETDIQVPNEGRFVLAAKVTDLGTGFWRYEYALYNMNSDRSGGTFSMPLSANVTIQNVGFRDVPYHSGEPFDGTDWSAVVENGAITWSTTPHSVNANANALRWGTLYNFRFDANVPPQNAVATIGLFKPGTPSTITAVTHGPGTAVDCNQNGLPDDCDLNCGSPGGACDLAGCGLAEDCNGNGVPDDCEPDCNKNGIADACDVSGGASRDCNSNGVPDECEELPEFPLATALVASGFTQPVFVTAPPGDTTRLFVVEQGGRIKIINLLTNTVLSTPFLNISTLITVGGERGLLSMAFDPNYSSNRYFYVNYTNLTPPGDTVIARYTVPLATPDVADPTSAVILKVIDQDFQNHKGGQIQFGPDDMLYVGMGDGGSANDPLNRAQDPGTLLGKMLRLNPHNPPTYVPADNPYVGPGNPLDEIWAMGMRNPWRFSFDRLTGDMYIGDVGQDAVEEINFEPAGSPGGRNYGWRCMEGTFCTGSSGCICNSPSLTLPIHQYLHNIPGAPCYSLTGGYVYRGCQIPHLGGTYFYADYCLDRIWSFRFDGTSVTDLVERTSELATPQGPISSPSSFGEDANGELYIVSHQGGRVYRIVPYGGDPTCGNGLLESGEECDDGNLIPGDGCDSNCESENGSEICNDAPAICPGTYGGSTLGMLANGSSSCGISNKSPDVWYRYTPGEDGTLTVSLCGASNYDTVVSVHTGCPGNVLNEVGCDDDLCGNMRSFLTVPVIRAVDYYIRVSGYDRASGTFTLSLTGPACIVCPTVEFEDHFDTDLGWTVQNVDLADGAWQRGTPAGTGSTGDPTSCFGGSGQCYLTANRGGNSDVDGGPTYLISPSLDLSRGDETISYAYWFMRDDAQGDDALSVHISADNGGSWIQVANYTIGQTQWRTDSFRPRDYIGPSGTAKIRFGVWDNPNNSVVEAAIDAVVITRPCFPDCNGNGINDLVDISTQTSADCNGNSIPDECDLASGSSSDCDGGPVGLIDGGALIVAGNCFSCHGGEGTGGPGLPGPNLRNKSRVQIWNRLLPPTNHPGGAHPEFTQQDFADLEAFLADAGSRGRPDGIPDECQVLADCNAAPPSDGCELENGTQVDENYDGEPDDCTAPVCNVLSGEALGSRYLAFSGAPGTGRFAIQVDGEPDEPGVFCMSRYVQADGTLDTAPVRRTANAWGTMIVSDYEVRPDTRYRAQADCAWGISAEIQITTWPWGGSEPTGIVDVTDVLCTLSAYAGEYDLCSFEAANLLPCVPDSVIDVTEVLAVLDAYAGEPFPCEAPCPPE